MLLSAPNRPESLIVSSVKNLVGSFSSTQQRQISYHEQHLGGPKTAAEFLLALANYYSAKKHEQLRLCFEQHQPYLDPIIGVFSRYFVHGSSLNIPFSYSNIFPVHLLRDHLLVHGSRLNELIMNNYYDDSSSFSFDDFLESMTDWCSSKLKRLTLPKWEGEIINNVITQRGVIALIKTVSGTLEELNLCKCTFASMDLLLNLLSNLPKLKRLSLANVGVMYSNDENISKLPVPLVLDQLEHLIVYNFFHNKPSPRGCRLSFFRCDNTNENLEWGRLVEHLPKLKTFHLVIPETNEDKWLHSVKEGLMNRKWEPLEYLRIPVYTPGKRSIIYGAQNARQVSTDETIAQISTAFKHEKEYWGRDSNNYVSFTSIYCLLSVWRRLSSEYDVEFIRHIFEVIKCHLIPAYIYVSEVFNLCSEFLEVVVVKSPELRQKLGITSSFVDNFLTAILIPESKRQDIHLICAVFSVYGSTLSLSNFERVLSRAMYQLQHTVPETEAYTKIFTFLIDAAQSYCTLNHWLVMKKVLGRNSYWAVTKHFIFYMDCPLVQTFVEEMQKVDEKFQNRDISATS